MNATYSSAALFGLISGAFLARFTGRVADDTIDFALAGVQRVLENFLEEDQDDPEAHFAIAELQRLDISSKLRVTTSLISALEYQIAKHPKKENQLLDDPFTLALEDVKESKNSIETTIKQI